jgi:hypothetical protein
VRASVLTQKRDYSYRVTPSTKSFIETMKGEISASAEEIKKEKKP